MVQETAFTTRDERVLGKVGIHMAKKFNNEQWARIFELLDAHEDDYGLPKRRNKSVVIGTFNIRSLSKVSNRSEQSWDLLERICGRFDLLAIQEVRDNLEGIIALLDRLGKKYGLVVSDVTGSFPGSGGHAERLAYLFRWDRIVRTELASDITYDRSEIMKTLKGSRLKWNTYLREYIQWEEDKASGAISDSTKPPKAPTFLTFIRQPHCASFEIKSKSDAEKPIQFLAINVHLLYGNHAEERKQEFDALIGWMTLRSKQRKRMYHENLILLGDCNLEFGDAEDKRAAIDAYLKKLNKTVLKSSSAAKANFPLLSPHPTRPDEVLRTNARDNQTYDQIGIFSRDARLPRSDDNDDAGTRGPDGYDYGVFRFNDLFTRAVYEDEFEADVPPGYDDLNKTEKKYIIDRTEWDVSDHMPAWFRLPIPGA